jgi:pyrroloquinoline quinone (PQQ) biosynthesis protein C
MTNSATGLTAKSALMALKDTKEIGRYTPEEALAFLLNHSQTKKDYRDMKTAASEKGANIWPDYNQVLQAKQDCRPKGITIMETEAYVPLQNLMDHTVE